MTALTHGGLPIAQYLAAYGTPSHLTQLLAVHRDLDFETGLTRPLPQNLRPISRRMRATMLESAISADNVAMIELLDTRPDDTIPYGTMYSVIHRNAQEPIKRIIIAVIHKSPEAVEYELQAHNANVDQRTPDDSPILHLAVGNGDVKTVEMLLTYGADFTAVDRQGRDAKQILNRSPANLPNRAAIEKIIDDATNPDPRPRL